MFSMSCLYKDRVTSGHTLNSGTKLSSFVCEISAQ